MESYKNGMRDGVWREWSGWGWLIRDEKYKAGKPVGIWREWHENGLLKGKENTKQVSLLVVGENGMKMAN